MSKLLIKERTKAGPAVSVDREALGNVELTIGMPAHNCENHIFLAIESILRQKGVSFELVIVDDCSGDRTSDIVCSFQDPRITLIRQPHHVGNAHCQNIVIQKSVAPFLAFVKPHEIVLPGALKRMVMKLQGDHTIGQVCCYCLATGEDGVHSRTQFRKRKSRILQRKSFTGNGAQDLMIPSAETFSLRTYRREVFQEVGLFNETLRKEYECEMLLRMLPFYEIKVLPSFLCWSKKSKAKGLFLFPQKIRIMLETLKMVFQFGTGQTLHFGSPKSFPVKRWLLAGFLVNVRGNIRFLRYAWGTFSSYSRKMFRLRRRSFSKQIYARLVTSLSRWPISVWKGQPQSNGHIPTRVAYYLFRFPILSETFIQREISALKNTGISVEVVAARHGALKLLDQNARALVDQTTYTHPIKPRILLNYVLYYFVRSPLLFVNLFFYVVGTTYEKNKFFEGDIRFFLKAVYLAGYLRDKKITRIHSPWANRPAFVALIASRLLRIPFTLQARASDIHRRSNRYALEEKFANAQIILTNTRFNEGYLKGILPEGEWPKIQVIYNGLDLRQFAPGITERNKSEKVNILSVARLIEPKGLVYLLGACRILKEKGYRFHCEIIGGQEEAYLAYHVLLKKLHREFGLDEWVTFSGAQPFNEVLGRYKISDIFVLPCVTAHDGSRDITPNSLIEAMAMKLPVISTKATAIPEIVDDGVNGFLVEPADEQALAKALTKLMDDCDLRKRFGEEGRRKVEKRFDINKNVYQWVECFEGVKEEI